MLPYVKKLFDVVGNDVEAVKWIKRFAEVERSEFAVIKISGASVDEHLDDLADDVGVLTNLDLYPPVVYGWGKALDALLAENDVKYTWDKDTGDRITTPAIM